MNRISQALQQIHTLDELSARDNWINNIHPAIKLIITLFYNILVISFDKYEIFPLLTMAIYLLIMYEIAKISIFKTLYHLKFIILFIALFGVLNPLFDQTQFFSMGKIAITGGMISMISLLIKGVLSILASYLLIATTPIENICHVLKAFHFPNILITQILLLYRYIPLFLLEVKHTLESYSLRSPKTKGIAFRTWGSLVGLILLRSIDRAYEVYQSMCIRGYQNFSYTHKYRITGQSIAFFVFWIAVLLILRFTPITEMIGGLFT
ncbi:MAG: cobalt ECF transporter T component CbiQ [Helicobacter sp.]|nr:cobalt ECF transporter T component CbiQ [Helicobacter sp.]